jgi:hypothetical protein
MATEKSNSKKFRVVGVFERVEFPEFGVRNVIAKIDTGAYTGALHCKSITEKNGPDGKTLIFDPFGTDQTIEKEEFVIKYVKSSNGKREKRYFIATTMILAAEEHAITISLTDRSDMKWTVLVGRRFLKQYNYIVDPSKKIEVKS